MHFVSRITVVYRVFTMRVFRFIIKESGAAIYFIMRHGFLKRFLPDQVLGCKLCLSNDTGREGSNIMTHSHKVSGWLFLSLHTKVHVEILQLTSTYSCLCYECSVLCINISHPQKLNGICTGSRNSLNHHDITVFLKGLSNTNSRLGKVNTPFTSSYTFLRFITLPVLEQPTKSSITNF